VGLALELSIIKIHNEKRSGKNPVNFFPALHPVEYNCTISGDLNPDAILSCADAPVVFIPFHPVDIKC
jgi:hypothetical protein